MKTYNHKATITTFFLLVISFSDLIYPQSLKEKDFVYYRDDKFLFSAWYPKTWESVPATHKETRLKVLAENGIDDFSVNVIDNSGFAGMSPKDFVEYAFKQDYLKSLRTVFPDIVLLDRGTIYASNQGSAYENDDGVMKRPEQGMLLLL